MMATPQPEIEFLIGSPMEFEFDQRTGLLSVIAVASMKHLETPVNLRLRLSLTPETLQSLLSDLPKLEALLVQASKGPTKPDFLQ